MDEFEKQQSLKILSCYNLPKSQDNDLEKGGGEGSRGGKIIGHTKSGKPIYESKSTTTKGSKKEEVNSNKKSEKDQSISLREKLIKQGFSPEEAKKQVSGNEEKLDKDLSIHEDSKKIAEASGMSESEYKTLHSDTKKQLLDSYNKNNS